MRIYQTIAILLGVLFLSGCGDQFWCGEDGCPGKSMTPTSFDIPINIQKGLNVENIL